MMRLLAVVSTLVQVTVHTSEAFADLTLVKDGSPVASIVVGEKPTRAAQFAAYELQHVVGLVTGAKLPIVAKAPTATGNVFVGTASEGLKREEYIVVLKDGNLCLSGHDAADYGKVDYADAKTFPKLQYAYRSTEYAVYDFLERSCCVRFYGFGDDGIAFEPRKTLAVAPFAERRRAPKMDAFRDVYFGNKATVHLGQSERDADLLCHRWRSNVMFGEANHSVLGIYARYWKEPKPEHLKKLFVERRPDYFAKGYDGKMAPNSLRATVFPGDADLPPSLCNSSEGPVDYFADEAVRMRAGEKIPFTYAERPVMEDQPFYYPVQEDDSTSWCLCEKCLGNPRLKDYRFRHFDWVSRIARKAAAKDPSVFVSTLAYEDTLAWPEGVELAPNLGVEICLSLQSWFSPNVYRRQHGAYKSWIEREGGKRLLTLWVYMLCPWAEVKYVHGYGAFFPVVYPRHTGRYFKEFMKDGIRGCFFNAVPRYHMLELYVAARLCDDPTLDPDALIDEHYRLYYGAAADAMKRFGDELEKYSFDIANYSPRVKSLNPGGSYIYRLHEEKDNWHLGSSNAVKRFDALMEQAKAAAKTPLEKRRVGQYAKWIWDDVPAGRKAFEERERNRSIPLPWISAPDEGDYGGDLSRVGYSRTSAPFRTLDNEPADVEARMKMAADGKYAYFRYEEKDATAKAHVGMDIWSNSLELHLHGAKPSDLLQIAISPSGEVRALSSVVEAGVRRTDGFSNPPKARSVVTDEGWTVEIAVPFSMLPGGVPGPHFDRIGANFFRTRGWPGGCALAWSPIFKKAYLDVEDRLGTLVFCAHSKKK